MERTQRDAIAAEHHRLAHLLERRDRTCDESCDEPAFGLDERDDLRADAEGGRCFGRRELDRAVDPEQAVSFPATRSTNAPRRPRPSGCGS